MTEKGFRITRSQLRARDSSLNFSVKVTLRCILVATSYFFVARVLTICAPRVTIVLH